MYTHLFEPTSTAFNGLATSRSIVRMDTGHRIGNVLARRVGHLPERLLTDIGLHRVR